MNAKRLIIIGGGVSGVMASITAKKLNSDLDVLIIEKQDKLLKKLLVTGNGRCNFTNKNLDYKFYNNPSFAENVISSFDNKTLIKTMNELGLYSEADEEGRVYPYSKQAKSVWQVLVNEIERLNIKVKLSSSVDKVEKTDKFVIVTNDEKLEADYLLVSVGGKSGGNAYKRSGEFLNDLDIPFKEEHPVLVPVKTDKKEVKRLDGVRAKALVTLTENERQVFKEEGEVLFRDYGISGIVIFNMSRFVNLNKNQKVHLDFFSEFDFDAFISFLKIRKKNLANYNFYNFFDGLLNEKLVRVILDRLNFADKKVSTLTDSEIHKIASVLKDFDLNVTGIMDYDLSQVTSGGVDLKFVNESTLESKKIDNLYFAGEILDIDAFCGGYNLQFAFSSGVVAGKSIAKRV